MVESLLPDRKRASRSDAIVVPSNAGLRKAMVLMLVLAVCMPAIASPGKALQKYEAGQFLDAQKEFQKLLEKKPDDARLHYNAGTAAFRAKHYEEAAKFFGEALTAPDLQLQQQAFYNLGDTLYRLGEEAAELNQKATHWEKSLKQFESALKLNPSDTDAKQNVEFVKRKLEELKQQQKKNQPDDVKPSDAAKKAKAQADEAVRRQEYARALEIMESQLKNDPTTRYYADYMQRLKEVNGVQAIDQH